jgi:hypothetical protein
LPGDQPITRDLSSCGEHSPKEPPASEPGSTDPGRRRDQIQAIAWNGGIAGKDGIENPGVGIAKATNGELLAVLSYFDYRIPEGARISIGKERDGVWMVDSVIK